MRRLPRCRSFWTVLAYCAWQVTAALVDDAATALVDAAAGAAPPKPLHRYHAACLKGSMQWPDSGARPRALSWKKDAQVQSLGQSAPFVRIFGGLAHKVSEVDGKWTTGATVLAAVKLHFGTGAKDASVVDSGMVMHVNFGGNVVLGFNRSGFPCAGAPCAASPVEVVPARIDDIALAGDFLAIYTWRWEPGTMPPLIRRNGIEATSPVASETSGPDLLAVDLGELLVWDVVLSHDALAAAEGCLCARLGLGCAGQASQCLPEACSEVPRFQVGDSVEPSAKFMSTDDAGDSIPVQPGDVGTVSHVDASGDIRVRFDFDQSQEHQVSKGNLDEV